MFIKTIDINIVDNRIDYALLSYKNGGILELGASILKICSMAEYEEIIAYYPRIKEICMSNIGYNTFNNSFLLLFNVPYTNLYTIEIKCLYSYRETIYIDFKTKMDSFYDNDEVITEFFILSINKKYSNFNFIK
jgi:hypothetical protein